MLVWNPVLWFVSMSRFRVLDPYYCIAMSRSYVPFQLPVLTCNFCAPVLLLIVYASPVYKSDDNLTSLYHLNSYLYYDRQHYVWFTQLLQCCPQSLVSTGFDSRDILLIQPIKLILRLIKHIHLIWKCNKDIITITNCMYVYIILDNTNILR